MIVWASFAATVAAVVGYLSSDLSALLTGAAELAAVIGLFALVCAAEALN